MPHGRRCGHWEIEVRLLLFFWKEQTDMRFILLYRCAADMLIFCHLYTKRTVYFYDSRMVCCFLTRFLQSATHPLLCRTIFPDRFEDDQLSTSIVIVLPSFSPHWNSKDLIHSQTVGVDLKIKLLDVEPAQPGGKPRRIKVRNNDLIRRNLATD